jgi:hypothetical protein
VGLWLGGLFLAIALIVLPTSDTLGAGILATPGASATVDPGQGTPGDPDPRPTQTATRPPTTPTTVPTPTPRAGALNIIPTSSAVGVEVTLTGSGFSPNALVIVVVEDSTGSNMAYIQPTVDASGGFTVRLSTMAYKAGEYTVSVAALPDIKALAQATFTLSGTPGLPNTGEGANTGHTARTIWFLVGAALLTLSVFGGVAIRRRLVEPR